METRPIEDVLLIPQEDLPLMVLSDNPQSFLSFGIKAHQNGYYNHFMWMTEVMKFASQNATYKQIPCQKYFKGRLKMWHNPNWTDEEKRILTQACQKELDANWYSRTYDWVQIIGIAVGFRYLQLPWKKICSDRVDILHEINAAWELSKHLSPPELNRLFKDDDRYEVYGRFDPDVIK